MNIDEKDYEVDGFKPSEYILLIISVIVIFAIARHFI